jgi:ATP-dependent helicase HepA
VLRYRRSSVDGLTPGRSGVEVIKYRSSASRQVFEALEDWRFHELLAVRRTPESVPNAEELYTQLTGRILQYAAGSVAGASALTQRTDVPNEVERYEAVLHQILSPDVFEDRLAALIATLRPLLRPKHQFVLFCSESSTADILADRLREQLQIPVDRHSLETDRWEDFNVDPARPVLVCDLRAEEGLNLQGPRKTVIHWDLPLSPNRIEQRLGRLDRYGSADEISSLVLQCDDNPTEEAWIAYLAHALKIFDRSVASLQYLIDDTMRSLSSSLFSEGPEALSDLTALGSGEEGRIEREMRSIDHQDALDALAAPAPDLVDQLNDLDADWKSVDRDASIWIEQTLHFVRAPTGVQVSEAAASPPFHYQYVTANQHTLLPLETFYRACRSAIDSSDEAKRLRLVRTNPATFHRRTAMGRIGRSMRARVLRYGDTFIQGMWDITQADDRGRSTALWRYAPGYASYSVADLFFRFDFIAEADVRGAHNVLDRFGRLSNASNAAIVRRGDMALPPFFETVWLDRELHRVTDKATLDLLQLKFRPEGEERGGRDFNLNPKRWDQVQRLEIPELAHWGGICARAREEATSLLQSTASFSRRIADAEQRAKEVEEARLGLLRARAENTASRADMREWEIEQQLSTALVEGVNAPSVRVDAILACFLTGNISATMAVDSRR